MIFPDNDRPGVMLALAPRRNTHSPDGVACGSRVVIAANSDQAYRVARSLSQLGADVLAIVDRRAESAVDRGAVSDMRRQGLLRFGYSQGDRGAMRYAPVRSHRSALNRPARRRHRMRFDLERRRLCTAVHRSFAGGGSCAGSMIHRCLFPISLWPGVVSVGAWRGVFGRDAAIEHAARVGTGESPAGRRFPRHHRGGRGRCLAN